MLMNDTIINMDEPDVVLTLIENYVAAPDCISEEVIQKAKRLLNNYRHVLWSIKSNVHELEQECQVVMKEDLLDVMDILDKYDYRMDRGKLDDKLRASQEVRLMEKMIVIAMQKVKEYPELGVTYYEVLRLNYLMKSNSKEAAILNRMCLARSTYYKFKKDAIKIFGYCLWKIILPNIKNAKSTGKSQPHAVPILGMVHAS